MFVISGGDCVRKMQNYDTIVFQTNAFLIKTFLVLITCKGKSLSRIFTSVERINQDQLQKLQLQGKIPLNWIPVFQIPDGSMF